MEAFLPTLIGFFPHVQNTQASGLSEDSFTKTDHNPNKNLLV